MCIIPDGTGIITGGADNCIKIWKFNLKMIGDIKQLCIVLVKTVKSKMKYYQLYIRW